MWLHPHRLEFLAVVSDSFGALVQGSGGRGREGEEREMLHFSLPGCALLMHIFPSPLYLPHMHSHTHIHCVRVRAEKASFCFPPLYSFPREPVLLLSYTTRLSSSASFSMLSALLHTHTHTHTHSCNKAVQWVLEELWAKAGQRSERQGAKIKKTCKTQPSQKKLLKQSFTHTQLHTHTRMHTHSWKSHLCCYTHKGTH